MGSIYLDWLDDVVKEAAAETGYSWSVFDSSWLHRSRSSGGYDSPPLCVMWHHTAGGDDAWGDARYQCYSADARPISNITVDSKVALVLAGGATNTNGSGINSPMTFSRGTVAKDDMNRRAVGIEICNNGTGAPYPEKQINFLMALSNKINAKCGNQPTDVMSHQGYAPDRKVDPSRADAVQGPWKPRSVTSSGSWSVDDLRSELKRRWTGAGPTPPPTPETEDEDVVWRVAKRENGAYFIGDGKTAYWVSGKDGDMDDDEARILMAPGAVNAVRLVWDQAKDDTAGPTIVTTWGGVKTTMQDKNIKKYIGATKRF